MLLPCLCSLQLGGAVCTSDLGYHLYSRLSSGQSARKHCRRWPSTKPSVTALWAREKEGNNIVSKEYSSATAMVELRPLPHFGHFPSCSQTLGTALDAMLLTFRVRAPYFSGFPSFLICPFLILLLPPHFLFYFFRLIKSSLLVLVMCMHVYLCGDTHM